jgi:hypothetical protein
VGRRAGRRCHGDDFDADGDGIGNATGPNDESWQGAWWHDDMFPDAQENYLGTDKDVACSTRGGPDNEPLDLSTGDRLIIFMGQGPHGAKGLNPQ